MGWDPGQITLEQEYLDLSAGWIVGPVWTALYAMMAVAGWQVWRRAGVEG